MTQYLVFVGAIVQLIGIASYIKDIIKGDTKPNRVTWLLWSIAPLIATFAAMSNGVKWSVIPVFMTGLGPLLVLFVSFANKNSYWKLEKLDYLCGLFSILALVLWGITKQPNIAIIFSIIGDGLAAIPTLIKSWKHPETETVDAYTTSLFNSLTSFAAIKMWTFAEIAFPVYLVFVNSVLIISILRKKIFKYVQRSNHL